MYGRAQEKRSEPMTYMLPRLAVEVKLDVDKGYATRPPYTKSGRPPFSNSMGDIFMKKGVLDIQVRLNFATSKDFEGEKE